MPLLMNATPLPDMMQDPCHYFMCRRNLLSITSLIPRQPYAINCMHNQLALFILSSSEPVKEPSV